ADGEPPVDGGAIGAGGPVQEPPVHGGTGGLAVDLDHVVLPLDALATTVVHTGAVHTAVVHAGVVHTAVVHIAVIHPGVIHTAVVHVAGVYAGVFVIGRSSPHRAGGEQFHAALWAVTRLIASTSGCMGHA